MDVVVVVEELVAERSRVLDAAKALGKTRAVLQGLEGRFGDWVVVAHVGRRVTPRHAQVVVGRSAIAPLENTCRPPTTVKSEVMVGISSTAISK